MEDNIKDALQEAEDISLPSYLVYTLYSGVYIVFWCIYLILVYLLFAGKYIVCWWIYYIMVYKLYYG